MFRQVQILTRYQNRSNCDQPQAVQAAAGTSPEATEKEQQSTLKIKNAPKIYNRNITTPEVENSVSQIIKTGSFEKIPSSLCSPFYSYMYR